MNRTSNVMMSSKSTLALLAVMAVVLAGCGRKAGLDLPPSAAATPTANEVPTEPEAKDAAAAQSAMFNAANPADRTRYAPKGPQKRIILDPILD